MRIRTSNSLALVVAGILLAGSVAVFAGKTSTTDLPVTTYLTDFSASGTAYYVQSDGGGAYQNGVSGVGSYLVANGYNHITLGDWRLDLFNAPSRQVAVTFSTANAVQPGDPGYTAPANPPYWGTKWSSLHVENKCTVDSHDMLTMKAGDTFDCDTLIHFPSTTKDFYRLDMGTYDSGYPEPETQKVQVSCNSSASDGDCNDWFLDPIPVVNPDGSTSPGKTRARLNYVSRSTVDEGDFYLTFHIHVTRP